jgi:hypothetical protein
VKKMGASVGVSDAPATTADLYPIEPQVVFLSARDPVQTKWALDKIPVGDDLA